MRNPERDRPDRSANQLIERIIAREATPADWAELAACADIDDMIWARLNAALVTEDSVRSAAAWAAARSEHIDLPVEGASTPQRRTPVRFAPIASRITAWSGWAAAAVIALGFLGWLSGHSGVRRPSAPDREVMTPTELSAVDALAQYRRAGLAEGIIIEELPLLTVRTRLAPEGAGVEVLYLRRIIERTFVDENHVVTLASDEHGRTVTVPAADIIRRTRSSL